MKRLIFLSFIAFLLLIPSSLAQIQYYGAEIELEESGRASVELTITFQKLEKSFSFNLIGKMEDLEAQSSAGPIDCDLQTNAISSLKCFFNLTPENRTIRIYFSTNDFVKRIGDRWFFSSDLTLHKNISSVHISVRLPEGMVLVGKNKTASMLSFPENAMIVSDGRRIIVIWQIASVTSNQPLLFQFLYEKVLSFAPLDARLVVGVVAIIVIVLSFLYLRYWRKPEKLVLSVLDEYERKVMDAIISAGGSVEQRKVVKETNLSKAKVSRVVRNLEKRGLIEVERLGRTNKLKLVEKKFKP